MRALGIDVSSVQGVIDWPAVARAGIVFAYVKATSGVGRELDPCFKRNIAGARAAGIQASLYHWWVWSRDPVEQAANIEWAAELVGGVDFPVALDFEAPTPEQWAGKHVDPKRLAPNVTTCAEEVKRRLGRGPTLYTIPWFCNALPADTVAELTRFELWLAAGNKYGSPWRPTDQENPPKLAPWGAKWTLWQYSGNGGERLPGIWSDVDRNVFNGTKEEFQAWAGGHREIPAAPSKPAALDVFARK